MLWGNPTSLSNFSLTITGSGNTIAIGQVATAANFNLNASSGGQIVFPLLTQIAETNYNSIQASGTGSLLNLSQVTAITGNNQVTIQTSSGADINLQNLTSISSGENVYLQASGGTIECAERGGRDQQRRHHERAAFQFRAVLLGSPTSLSNFSLTITGSGNTIAIGQVATAANLNLNASSGGQIVFPLLTQIAETNYNSSQASGTGSLLDLSHVTAITGSNQVSIQANSGSDINLHNLSSVSSGETVYLNASGGTIDVSSLSPIPKSIQVQSGGNILMGNVTLHNGTVALSGSGSTFTVQGSLSADAGTSLNLADHTLLVLEGSFSDGITSGTQLSQLLRPRCR